MVMLPCQETMIITCVATDGNESSFGKRYALLGLGVALPKCQHLTRILWQLDTI